ncbi:MAG: molybdopterin molybdotransferase MoeA [Bacteriovoracaceae bacterium]
MVTVSEALRLIRENLPDFGNTMTELAHYGQDTLSEDLFADRDYPPFHRVMMDGIAVNFNIYLEGKRDFKIAGISPAGEPQKILNNPSTCLEVMTGAPLPSGADLVVPYEHLKNENGIASVVKDIERTAMENVHLHGSDAKSGDVLLRSGQPMNGPHWGIAASVGKDKIKTRKKAFINIISTGDELVEVNVSPEAHQIRRSNAHALKASLKLHGFENVVLSHLPDETTAIEEHYKSASKRFDLLIYSGGVSKGKFDYLPETWKKLGVKEIFHGVAQRPGKPLWFGVDEKTKTVILGLPGNPVSSLVCLHRYFLHEKDIFAELTEEIVFKNSLTDFVPVKIEFSPAGTLLAHPLKIKNSGEFSALAGSDGLLELPQDPTVFRAGEAFLFHPWRPW